MLFHHRHVLVGGCVKDHVGLFGRDQALHRRLARDIRQVRTEVSQALVATSLCLEFALDQVERALRPIHEDEPSRLELEDLPSELGSDRPSRTGDQNGPVAQDVVDRGRMLGAGRAAKEVLDLDATDSVRVKRAVEEVVHGGDCPDVEATSHRGVDDRSDRSARRTWHRDQESDRPGRRDRAVQGLQIHRRREG